MGGITMSNDDQATARAQVITRFRHQKAEVDRVCTTARLGSTTLLPESDAAFYNETLDHLMETGVEVEPDLRVRSDEIVRPLSRDTTGSPGVQAGWLRAKLTTALRRYSAED